jgi:glyoxylase I family protein
MKLGAMMVFVPDLDGARRFYRDVLGFPVKAERTDHIVFAHEGCDLVAFRCERPAEVRDYSQAARSVFVFEVGSIEETMDDLRKQGVYVLHDRPAENEFSRYAAFTDPFGIVHEIYEPKRGD